jgi:TRAP-type C4-dicarboxylate transport system substrate-binding protein
MLFRRIFSIAAAILALSAREAQAGEVVRIGTLAPSASPWGQVYKVWAEAVQKKSEGRLELQFFWNGQQGDEAAMVAKMKSGQLDGATLTSVGLAKIYKPVLALQIPGLFRSWEKLDAARAALAPELEKGIADAGFTLGGWGDVGAIHLMSKGFAVRVPEDFRGRKPLTWREDQIGPTLFQVIGGVTPVPQSAPEVLSSLGTGAIDVLSAPALAAEQLQWASRLDHIGEDASVFAIGAMVFVTKRIDALPEDLRAILRDTGKVAASALAARIRKEDAAAFERLKGRMTVVKLTEEEKAKWASVLRQTAERLAKGTFPAELMERLVKLAGVEIGPARK